MNASMHWLSDRLGNCPDAADLEYGCVDWFRYEETDRSGARSRCRSRKRGGYSAAGQDVARPAAGRPECAARG